MNEGKKKHGSLFNGMGGFQLAAEWMGCCVTKFINLTAHYIFPKTTDFTIWRGKKSTFYQESLANHLWPEMRRAIREIQPPWVVGENVRGIISWNHGNGIRRSAS